MTYAHMTQLFGCCATRTLKEELAKFEGMPNTEQTRAVIKAVVLKHTNIPLSYIVVDYDLGTKAILIKKFYE